MISFFTDSTDCTGREGWKINFHNKQLIHFIVTILLGTVWSSAHIGILVLLRSQWVGRYIEHLHIWEEKLSAASLLCRTGRIKRLPNWTGETFALTPMLCTPAMKIYEIMGRNGLPNRGAAEFVEILIVTSSHHICNTEVRSRVAALERISFAAGIPYAFWHSNRLDITRKVKWCLHRK